MSKRRGQGGGNSTFASSYAAEDEEWVPAPIRWILALLGLFQSVCLFFYSVGWWQVKVGQLDNVDNVMTSVALFSGPLIAFFCLGVLNKRAKG